MQQSVPEFAIFDAGISVHPSLPYLGASPDGKVFDPSTENKYGLLEIKCPFPKRRDTLEQAASDPNFYMEKHGETFCLKKDHFYSVRKYKGSWLLPGYCGVISVCICQTPMKCVLTGFNLIPTTGQISYCPN